MTPLHFAAKQGKQDRVLQLIGTGLPVNGHMSRDKTTPLHVAAASTRADVDMIRTLIDAGASVSAADSLGRTPLFGAKNLAVMKVLVEADADPLYVAKSGYGMLSSAKTVEEAEYLLDLGADPNIRSDWGETCLTSAALWRGPDLARLLLARGANPEIANWTNFHVDVVMGDVEAVQGRLARGENPSKFGSSFWSVWHMCIRLGNLEIAQLFLQAGLNVNEGMERGFMPLIAACETNSQPMVELLLSAGADPNKPNDFGSTALMSAAQAGNPLVVERLLEAGALVDAENQVQSRAITDSANAEVVQRLVNAGADINYIDGQGQFLLSGAAREGDIEFIRALIHIGADPNLERYGGSALMTAASYDELDIAAILLEAGANPNCADCDGYTAMFRLYSAQMAQLLLDAGADLELSDIVGDTALEKAIWPEVADILGVDISLSASRGMFDATGCGDNESLGFFMRLGADVNYQTSWQASALLEAAEANDLASVETLLAANCNVQHVDYTGNTALHFACGAGQIKFGAVFMDEDDPTVPALIDRLLSAGINATAVNSKRQTPLHVAILAKRPKAVAAMARVSSDTEKVAARKLAKKKLSGPMKQEVLTALS